MGGTHTQYKCDVVFLIPGKQFSYNFLTSWTKTITYLHENNISYFYSFLYFPIISGVRNHLLGKSPLNIVNQKKEDCFTTVFNNEVICDKVIMIDDDMVWEPQAIEQLLNSPYDVTVAPYILSDFVTTSINLDGKFAIKEIWENNTKPFPIQSGGLGFTACNFNVLQKLPYPWFAVEEHLFKYKDAPDRGGQIGEDVYFFNKVREAGFTPYCDPRIKVGHEKSSILTI